MILVLIWLDKCFSSLRRFAVQAAKEVFKNLSGMELLKFLNRKRKEKNDLGIYFVVFRVRNGGCKSKKFDLMIVTSILQYRQKSEPKSLWN